MSPSVSAWSDAAPWRSPAALGGLLVVAAARLLTLPASPWELDELLFMRGVEHFDPVHHRPHPPGYPVVVGLGKLLGALGLSPFHALVASSVVCSLVGYLALVSAYSRLAAPAGTVAKREDRAVGVAGALLFCLSPPMLLYGPLALSDAPALAFLALSLAAAVGLAPRHADDHPAGAGRPLRHAAALGGFAAAAVGCRPQLVVAVVPMVVVALAVAGRSLARPSTPPNVARGALLRLAAATTAAFAVVATAWFVPLAIASGGPVGLLQAIQKQGALVAAVDAGAARAGFGVASTVVRFVAHPWGPKFLAVPVLLLAIAGARAVLRDRRWQTAPLLVLSATDLVFALAVMDPADAVRYALPSLLAVAFLAALGCRAAAQAVRLPSAHWLATAALVCGFAVYTGPLLRVRATTPSPPLQAIAWAATHVPRRALVLVDPPLAPHASQLLADRELRLADPGLSGLAGAAAHRPVFLFSDGASRWPGAVSFRWPHSDAYGKLTRGYYRVVSWTPLPAGCRYAALDGVHAWENGWRWLDRQASIRVPTAGASTLRLTLAAPAEVPYPGVDVDISVAGRALTKVWVPREGKAHATLALPDSPHVEVRLRADRSFIPADARVGTDTRRLAVQLLGCELDAPPRAKRAAAPLHP